MSSRGTMAEPDRSDSDSGEASERPRIGDRLRADLVAECDRALQHLHKPAALSAGDIHEARKSLRRMRAWLTWSKCRKQPEVAALNAELKAIRNELALVRDAGSMVESIARLQRRKMAQGLRDEFDAWKAPLTSAADETLRRFAGSRSRASLANRIASAKAGLDSVPAIGKAQINSGLKASRKRALRAAAALATLTEPEARHDVRRRMRLLNLQLQQAQALGRLRGCDALLQPCDRLTKALGLESDLMVLLKRAAMPRQRCSAALSEWLQRRREKLLRRSNRLAKDFVASAK